MVNPSNITTLLPPQPAVDLTQPAVEPVTPLGVEHMQPMFRGYRVSRSTTELPPFDQYDQSLMFGMDLSQSDDLAQSSAYMGAVEASPSENWFLGDVPSNVEPQTYSVSELPSYPAQMWTEHVIDEQAYDWWDAASFTNINDPIGMATYQPADVLSTILLSDGHLVPEIPHGDESGRTDKDNSLLESTQNDMTALSNVRDTDRSITGEKRKHDAFSGDHNNVDLATADLYHMQTPPSSSRATQQSHQGPIQVHGQSSQALLATSSTASDGRSEPDGVDENAIGQYSPSVDTDKRGSARGPAKASLSSSSTEKRPRYSF
ncbi:uncharacterized protein HMPREF1541_02867 [Cyphellophora europaea CBS 101466]|uniref:Uncharacterized protein n=1 Tax=Cyphellophora europaea (strain CBS 101466) TaxID=1220924 RepID=W2S6P2_CYPE1|nr:uncharacterized protein HMPREF1541_02867 [Cyphellophora europaea CBS 101466]ETN43708.1 hypothetical protein HMPREF1541_02867 [Cyphellophora europaea CBS 101466]